MMLARLLARGKRRLAATSAALTLGAVAYVFSPLPWLAVIGGLAYVAGAALRPVLALQAVVFSAPFYLVVKGSPGLPFSPTEFLLLGCLAGWTARALWERAGMAKAGKNPWRWPGVEWPVALFLAGALLATWAAEAQDLHLRHLRVVVLEPLAFYLMARRVAREEKGFFALVGALALAAAAVSAYAVYQYLLTTDTIVAEGVARARAFYGSPNNLGIFLGRVLPILVCLAVWGDRGRGAYAAAAGLAGVALGLTFSVGAWLGTATALLYAAGLGGRWRLALGVAGAGALALLAGWLLGIERITLHFDLDAGTSRWRLLVWQAGSRMALDHPLLGVGLDNFLVHYPRYMAAEAWPEPNLSHPHNFVLDFWLSTGLLGLAAAVWLLVGLWRAAWRLWRRGGSANLRAAGLGLGASTVALVVHGAFDNSYFLVDLAILFWLAQALARAQHAPAQSGMIGPASAST